MKLCLLALIGALLSSPAFAQSTLYSNSTTGQVGIGTTAPDALLSLNGQSAQTIDMVRETTASTAGNNLTIQAGGAIIGGTNLNGGTLNLTSGLSTGTGSSSINFNVYPAGSSGSADNSPTTAIALTGVGLNLISGVYQVNGTQIAASNLLNGVTGSGSIVLAISPTLTTPNIGAATGTSLAVTGNITTSGGQIGVGTATLTAGAALDLSYNTNSMILPVGTTGQEPATPVNGMIRLNSTIPGVEAYYGGAWNTLGVGIGTTILPNGTTATTQPTNDSSTKVATTAFANPGSSIGANGYVTLPSGVIIQWGSLTSSSSGPTTITFPIAFSNACFTVTANQTQTTAGTAVATIDSITTTTFHGAVFNPGDRHIEPRHSTG